MKIETKSESTKREALGYVPEGATRAEVPPLVVPHNRTTFRPERVEFSAEREADEDGPLRWWVVVRGTRILASGELGRARGIAVFSWSKAGQVEELPEWLAPWTREQIAAFAVTTRAGA